MRSTLVNSTTTIEKGHCGKKCHGLSKKRHILSILWLEGTCIVECVTHMVKITMVLVDRSHGGGWQFDTDTVKSRRYLDAVKQLMYLDAVKPRRLHWRHSNQFWSTSQSTKGLWWFDRVSTILEIGKIQFKPNLFIFEIGQNPRKWVWVVSVGHYDKYNMQNKVLHQNPTFSDFFNRTPKLSKFALLAHNGIFDSFLAKKAKIIFRVCNFIMGTILAFCKFPIKLVTCNLVPGALEGLPVQLA